MKKQILGGLAAAAVLAGGIAFVPAGIASAHHPNVTGEARCRETGSYEITWTAVSDDPGRGKTWSTSAPEVRGPANESESFTFITTAPGSATSASISVTASWAGGPYDVTRTGDVSLAGDCRPTQPPAEVVRVHSCETPGVVYVTTTPYVWDPQSWSWVPGTPVETTEPATPEQIESCTPDPKVTVTQWKDETIVCNATTVAQTRTVTTTPYVWDPQTSTFVLDEANTTIVTETRTRELRPDEIVPCAVLPPGPSSTTTTTTMVSALPPTPPPTAGPASAAPSAPSAPSGNLPATGSDSTGVMALLALLITALGGAAVMAARRRNATG
jgi:LPXTG-motif cell wall-anchored protein